MNSITIRNVCMPYQTGVLALDTINITVTAPKILFLDEPTVGMNAFSRKAMWECIMKIKDTFGTTIVLTTHYLEEAEALSDTICIIDQGTKEELATIIEKLYLSLTVEKTSDIRKTEKIIHIYYPTHSVIQKDLQILLENRNLDSISILQLLQKNNIQLSSMGIVKPTLEDIFFEILRKKEGVTI